MDKIKSPQPSSSSPPVPPWFAKAGAVFVGVTLLFFMSLIGASILQHDIPTNGKPLVVIVLALSIALSFAFIGGNAAAEGNVPLPFAKDKPVAFSVGGGIAAFVIVLLLGFGLYAK